MSKIDTLIDVSIQTQQIIKDQKESLDAVARSIQSLADAIKGMTVTREIIRETVQYQSPKDDIERDTGVIHLVSDHVSSRETIPVAMPSKLELAKQWLMEHPEDMDVPNRQLEDICKPMGVSIGYQTWNRAKKESQK